MYDLRWVMQNSQITGPLDRSLIRRLAVLKIWVDANALWAGKIYWRKGHQGPPFDPDHWLRNRDESEFDVEDIGALAVPVPSVSELSNALQTQFSFLTELAEEEQIIAQAREQDRPLAWQLLAQLPGQRLRGIGIY